MGNLSILWRPVAARISAAPGSGALTRRYCDPLNIKMGQGNTQGCRHLRQSCPPWFSVGLLQLGHGGLTDTHLCSELSLGDPQVLTPCPNNGHGLEDMRFDNRLRDAGSMDLLTLQPR